MLLSLETLQKRCTSFKKGVVEVRATDNSTVIAYLSEGAYFGEIGILLTGVRSVTIRAKTACIFFVIQKDEFVRILDRFPEQKAFLKAVGRQRMQTTNPEDLVDDEEEEVKDLMENQSLLNEIENKDLIFEGQSKFSNVQTYADLSMKIKNYKLGKTKRLPWNATKMYPATDHFIVIPFSKLYYIWVVIMLIA
jgi:CRP-like cAMP-binding protein